MRHSSYCGRLIGGGVREGGDGADGCCTGAARARELLALPSLTLGESSPTLRTRTRGRSSGEARARSVRGSAGRLDLGGWDGEYAGGKGV